MNAAAAAVVVLNGRQAFDPRASLFAHNEPGFWYDPTDLSSMYQDSAGTTPVTAVEQAVGLILDKSKGLVLGPELATTTSFTGVAIGGPAVTTYDTGAVVVAGKTYELRATITGYTGSADVGFGSGAFGSLARATADGVYTWRVAAVASNNVVMFTRNTNTCNYSNISVRELAGNHAIQPGATNRPTLRARYNRLTRSEELGNADWNVSSGTAPSATNIAAPDGTLTACRFDYSLTPATRFRYQSSTLPAAGDYTFYIWLKAQSACVVGLRFGDFTSASNTTAAVNVGTTWQRFSLTATIAAADLIGIVGIDQRASVISGVTENAVIDAWGADLRSSNDTYLPYQRIAAATDYDTVGFPVYLAFDGSDDSLYTGGNVDFSATDKITLWAGVTKLSDAAFGAIAELTANAVSNNGGFYLVAGGGAGSVGALYGGAINGSASYAADFQTFAAPITNALTQQMDIALAAGADELTLRADGVAATRGTTSGTNAGTGNFANAPLYIGRRNNATLPFNGRLYQLIGRGAATSAALITQAERWVAGKQGRAL